MTEQTTEPLKEETATTEKETSTWKEELELKGSELVDRVKELIEEGNVRHLIIRNADNRILLQVPLTAGVAVGGALTIVAPVLAALGAMAALLVRVKIEVIREKNDQDPPAG